nr:hypothetical protein [uncultured Allomuricauda sp.]
MKHLMVFFTVLFFVTTVQSQTLFEDQSGESSYYFNDGPKGWIKFNSSSSSVSLGYNRKRGAGFDKTINRPNYSYNYNYIVGLNTTVTVEEGIGTVFSEQDISPGVGLELLFGILSRDYLDKKKKVKTNSISSLFLKGGVTNTKLTTIDTLQIEKNSANEWLYDLSLNINARLNCPYLKNGDSKIIYHFIGAALGRKKVSNLETLNKVELQSIINNNGSSQVVSIEEGRAGQLDLTSASYFFLDYGISPNLFGNNQIGFNTYYRGNYGGFKSVNNVGVGVFFSKKDEPQGVLGGIAFQLNDIGNNLESEVNLIDRSTVFFYVGYNL